jgi:hypothetical protein
LRKALQEYTLYKSYLAALQQYNTWDAYYRQKPSFTREPPPDDAAPSDHIHYENTKTKYETKLRDWENKHLDLASAAELALRKNLKFLSSIDDNSLDDIKSVCVPESIFKLHKLLFSTAQYRKW